MIQIDTELHKKINILDTYKDASVPPKEDLTKHKNLSPFVEQLVNSMYQSKQKVPISSWKKELEKIEHKILKDSAYGNTLKINTLDIDEKMISNQFLPDTYKYAISDTIKPIHFLDDFDEIETPGAFMDPGNRTQGTAIQEQYTINLDGYGFPNVVFTSQPYNKNSKTYSINISFFGSDYSFDINRKGLISDFQRDGDEYIDDNEYVLSLCGGNREKNDAIGTLFKKDSEHTEIPALFFLFKELGDTLQVIFIREMFEQESETYSVSNTVAFTHDNVYAARCRLLGVPCVRNTRVFTAGSKYEFLQPLGDSEEQLLANKTQFIETIQSNNLKIKANVSKILLQGFQVGKKKYNINSLSFDNQSNFRLYITNIVELIDDANETMDIIFKEHSDDLDLEEFKVELAVYQIRPFVSDKGVACTKIKQILMGDVSLITDRLKEFFYFDSKKGFAGSLERFFESSQKNNDNSPFFVSRYRGGATDDRETTQDILGLDIETYKKIRMELVGNEEKAYEIYAVLYPFLFFTNAIIPSNAGYVKKIYNKIIDSYSTSLTVKLMKEFSAFVNALDSEYGASIQTNSIQQSRAQRPRGQSRSRSRSQRSRSRSQRSRSQPPQMRPPLQPPASQKQFFRDPNKLNILPYEKNNVKTFKSKKAPVLLTRRQQRLQSHNKNIREKTKTNIQQNRWGFL